MAVSTGTVSLQECCRNIVDDFLMLQRVCLIYIHQMLTKRLQLTYLCELCVICNYNQFAPFFFNIDFNSVRYAGRDGSVGTAIRYRLDCPGIESQWRRIFRTPADQPWGPSSLL